MADKDDTHGGGDHGGGGHGGSGAKHATSGGSGGGNWVMKLLRSPVTWVAAGVGALLAAVVSGVVPIPTVGTDGTSPSSYSAPESPDVTASDGDVRSPSQPGSRRTARLGARACHSIVQRARADHGRDWERQLPPKVRKDCGRTIQEARWVDGRAALEVEEPRARPGDAEIVRVSVPYGDLDLTTSAGAERFLDRVKRAAIQVCGGQPDIRDLAARRAFRECVERTMDSVVAQLRAPRVTAMYRQPG
jgi:UrcA family protein